MVPAASATATGSALLEAPMLVAVVSPGHVRQALLRRTRGGMTVFAVALVVLGLLYMLAEVYLSRRRRR